MPQCIIATPIGPCRITAEDGFITGLDRVDAPLLPPADPLLAEAARQLTAYFAGTLTRFDLPLRAAGTDFQRRCWDALCQIPYGETRSYGQQAAQIGHAKAARAVGGANRHNPISIIIPCHRVIGADGSLTGYDGAAQSGLDVKRWLLEHEQRHAPLIRPATEADIPGIAATYDALLDHEAIHGTFSHWQKGVYPTEGSARAKVTAGEMVVMAQGSRILASMVLNQDQAPEYSRIPWHFTAAGEDVLVVHTLCIPPEHARQGIGRRMVAYAIVEGRRRGARVIRLETNRLNVPAQALYESCGFRVAGYSRMLLAGLIDTELVFLEYRL